MFKKLIMVSAICATSPIAFASTTQGVSGDDLAYAFGDADASAVRMLSDNEMQEVKGDLIFLPPLLAAVVKSAAVGAGLGAAGGIIVYTGEAGSDFTLTDATLAGLEGALVGSIPGGALVKGVPIIFKVTSVGVWAGLMAADSHGIVTVDEWGMSNEGSPSAPSNGISSPGGAGWSPSPSGNITIEPVN